MEIKLTEANFVETVEKSEKPVLVDFWATWCGPCRMIAPELEAVAEARSDVVVGKVNVDEEPVLANQFHINVIPTLVLLKGGEVKATYSGYMNQDGINYFIDKNL